MRRVVAFPCASQTLLGTLDAAGGTSGLLIVSGGNEVRAGAHRGMALLAARLAEAGVPVFRFDRRGVGDSSGENRGFAASRDDIAAALACFRAHQPQLARVIGFGNCDAATALGLFGAELGLDGLVLANPWVIAPQGDLPPPAAIRAHYAERLRDPAQWWRLLRGGVDISKLVKGLSHTAEKPSQAWADRLASALARQDISVTVLLASGDNTARAFRAEWDRPIFAPVRTRAAVATCDTASHSFAQAADKDWLFTQLLAAVR